MIDEPDVVTLLEAMATTLSDQVVPSTSGGAQHSARVVANLCRVIARDLAADDTLTTEALRTLLGRDGDLDELVEALDARITAGETPDDTLAVLLADAARRAEIAKQGYTDHGPA